MAQVRHIEALRHGNGPEAVLTALVALACAFDTTTRAGEAMAHFR